jgi:hypothetical protein
MRPAQGDGRFARNLLVDDVAFGASSEVTPKLVSPLDPAAINCP